MWNQEVQAVPGLTFPKGLHPILLLLLYVDQEPGCNKLTEGHTTEPRREDVSSSESNMSIVETLPEDIPDELGHEWRVLHPFELPGVRFPTDTMPPNQRRLAENDGIGGTYPNNRILG